MRRNRKVHEDAEVASDSSEDGAEEPVSALAKPETVTRDSPKPAAQGGDGGDIAKFLNLAFLEIRGFIGAKAHWLTVYGLAMMGIAIWLRIDYNYWIHAAEFIAMTAFATVLVVTGTVAQILDHDR